MERDKCAGRTSRITTIIERSLLNIQLIHHLRFLNTMQSNSYVPNTSKFVQLFLSIIFTLYLPPALAHHSPAAFNTAVTDFTLTGEIISVDMRNPHSAISLRVIEEDGTEAVWDIELSSINLLLRRGWDFDRLKPGEQVICVGNPSALDKHEMYMWSIILSDGTEFGR